MSKFLQSALTLKMVQSFRQGLSVNEFRFCCVADGEEHVRNCQLLTGPPALLTVVNCCPVYAIIIILYMCIC